MRQRSVELARVLMNTDEFVNWFSACAAKLVYASFPRPEKEARSAMVGTGNIAARSFLTDAAS